MSVLAAKPWLPARWVPLALSELLNDDRRSAVAESLPLNIEPLSSPESFKLEFLQNIHVNTVRSEGVLTFVTTYRSPFSIFIACRASVLQYSLKWCHKCVVKLPVIYPLRLIVYILKIISFALSSHMIWNPSFFMRLLECVTEDLVGEDDSAGAQLKCLLEKTRVLL